MNLPYLWKSYLRIQTNLNQIIMQQQGEEKQLLTEEKVQNSEDQTEKTEDIVDPIKELVQNANAIHTIGLLDYMDINNRQVEGVPLISLLCNKFLPLQAILSNREVQLKPDQDGRTPLHYAVQVDDVKAVNWCLSKGSKNVKDKFGNTPIMDAMRLGHRRSFLLCLHFQHYSQELPSLAAQYNRVWELKVMKKLEIIRDEEKQLRIALQTAVEYYNYQAVEYLASVVPNYDYYKIRCLTDSQAIINKVLKGKKRRQQLQSSTQGLLKTIVPYLVMILGIMYVDIYEINRYERLVSMWILGIIWFLMIIIGKINTSSPQQPQSILKLIKQPYFPVLDEICPDCFNFQKVTHDHCRKCGRCVEKFHYHSYVCVNSSNQILWYIFEFAILCMCWSLGKQILEFHEFRTVRTAQEFNIILLFFRIIQTTANRDIVEFAFFLFIFFFVLHQFFLCLQLIGMAFMNRTYQQVIQSQKYPHLYTTYKEDGKVKTKEIRIFGTYKLLGGLVVGVKNILCYFF